MLKCRHLSIGIHRSPQDVAAFAGDPHNLPRWATGLCRSIKQDGDQWRVETPHGEFGLRFAAANPYGVLDHEVTTPDGVVKVPMRVVANDEGCEVIFTLFHQPGMSDTAFAADAEMIERDLEMLKRLLEQS